MTGIVLGMALAHAPDGVPAAPLAALLRRARRERNLTLRAATEDIPGISATTLCRVERGERVLAAGPALLALADRLGLHRDEVLSAAGGLTTDGLRELADQRYRGSLARGHLRPEALRALRRIHLAQIALSHSGASLDSLANTFDVEMRPTTEPPGFDSPNCYRIPRPSSYVETRAWLAHAVAHLLIDQAEQHGLYCIPNADTPAEADATVLARYLLVPVARLRDEVRALALPPPRTALDLSEMCQFLATELRAPADWVAARLVEDGFVGALT